MEKIEESLACLNTHEDIKTASYLGCEVLMMKSNGYVNISKMCKLNGKHMPCWFQAKDNQEYIKFLMKQFDMKYDELIIDKTKLRKEYRGRYAHRYITDKVAQWISRELAFKVSKIIDDYINEENRLMIRAKDDKINSLIEEVKQLKIQNSEQKQDIAKLLENSDKLLNHAEESKKSFVDIKNLLHEMKSDYVPTKDWNVVCILKKDDDTYTTIRCLSTELNRRIKSRGLSRDDVIFRMETPNGVEFFTTFKSSPRIKQKIDTYRNDIKLKVGLEEFMEMLMEHKQRTELLIEETLNN